MRRPLLQLLLALVFSLPNLVAAAEEHWEYTIRPGDSFWKIAERYTDSVNNWGELLRINSIDKSADRAILPGTRIVIPISMLKLQPAPARVVAVNGAVSLVRADGQSAEITVGTELFSGDRVTTGDGQSLRLQFADQSELQVQANSEVVLDKLSQFKHSGMVDTRIRLNSGRIQTRVQQQKEGNRYEIKTPSAITAVRGTDFRLSAEGTEISRTEVTEGLVAVSAGDAEKGVDEGFGIIAEAGKPLPDPVKLLPPTEIGANSSTDDNELQVSWVELDGAASYRYAVATDANFDQVTLEGSTEANELVLEELSPGAYFLRVRGIDQFGLEGFDADRRYVIEAPSDEDFYAWMILLPIGILILSL